MKKIAFFDTKPYDRQWFDSLNTKYEIVYFENKLSPQTAQLANGFDGVCAFVNDTIDKKVINTLYDGGARVLAMRCAGYSNVDFKAAYEKINVVRVPAYSPYAVAEHTMALLLSLNRRIHKAYNRTRDFNFSLVGLTGLDLHGKTVGVIGTGKIGQVFITICRGFGMRVLAYDLYPNPNLDVEYTELDKLFEESDVISLHCPLTEQTQHILNEAAFAKMKKGVYILNTSRGALIDSAALLEALNNETVRGAGLDVYEEEADFFFEDFSGTIIHDDVLSLLVSRPNVILTSHQAFLTEEALVNIAQTTLKNLDEFFEGDALTNEVCYHCIEKKVTENCKKQKNGRCF
ncbi:2-hydroxyacid dehydrogenase [Scatolibacter rhodanostii]|uniref:2-hydroxyacid dehydrogenase n=1 Tax=Scatolibacter rhodanostii TaxID=2014781 RepID=UPI000C087722|nr:2-hydroxyacid dehydrogenase [Scatolibacter rhodanostii]